MSPLDLVIWGAAILGITLFVCIAAVAVVSTNRTIKGKK